MTTENAPAPEPVETPAPASTHAPQPMPDRAPPEGTRFVLNPKTKMYDVERIPDAEVKTAEPTKEKGAEVKPDAAADAFTPELPGHVPTSVQHNENVQGALRELGGLIRESGIAPEVGQSYLDVYAEYAMEHPASDVDPLNPGAVHAQLRAIWGDTYGKRWGHVQKAWDALSPKAQDWVANNAEHPIAMTRTLAAIGSGMFSLSREQAQAALDKMRADRKSPLYDLSHKEHRLYKDSYRNLSLVANREPKKGRQGSVDELVKDRTATEPKGDSPEAKIEAEIRQLRLDPAYSDKSKPNHKAVVERMRELYRQRYPD